MCDLLTQRNFLFVLSPRHQGLRTGQDKIRRIWMGVTMCHFKSIFPSATAQRPKTSSGCLCTSTQLFFFFASCKLVSLCILQKVCFESKSKTKQVLQFFLQFSLSLFFLCLFYGSINFFAVVDCRIHARPPRVCPRDARRFRKSQNQELAQNPKDSQQADFEITAAFHRTQCGSGYGV